MRRRPIAEVDAETQEVVSNSGSEQEFCLFDHMWKFGTSSAIMRSPEQAGKVTESLRHIGSEGRRGGFQHRAVEAWHVQRRHALRSGAFDNIPLAVLNSRVCVGI